MSKMKIVLHRSDYGGDPEIVERNSDAIPRIGEDVAYKGETFYVDNITYDLSAEYENTCIIDCWLMDEDYEY